MIRTRTWIVILAALAAVLALLSFFSLTAKKEGKTVQILQDGVVIEEIDLSAVTSERSFTIEWTRGGSNLITVQPGRIRVTEADCPDRVCVDQGWLSDQAAPIVCMPHRLMIRIKDGGGPDAVSQ
ncbi:MAG: NusG domain II-containing protein [Firmicutes bacterium]|nr:NusG domain II-containing protein [Bacillota bacterium]